MQNPKQFLMMNFCYCDYYHHWFALMFKIYLFQNFPTQKVRLTWSFTCSRIIYTLFWGIFSVHDMRFDVFFFIMFTIGAMKGLHKKLPFWWPESAKLKQTTTMFKLVHGQWNLYTHSVNVTVNCPYNFPLRFYLCTNPKWLM